MASPRINSNGSNPLSGFRREILSRVSGRWKSSLQKPGTDRSVDGNRNSSDLLPDLHVFQSLWHDARAIMSLPSDVSRSNTASKTGSTTDSCDSVISMTSEMVRILTRKVEPCDANSQNNESDSRILDYFYSEEVLEKLLNWASSCAEFEQRLKIHLLNMFSSILGQRSCQFFMDRQILKPLFRLIVACSEVSDRKQFEEKLAVVFNHLCFGISQYCEVLEALFSEAYMESDAGGHTLISALLCFIHWDGPVGQQARDALQVIVCLAVTHEDVASYIVSRSNFCPLLAAGLTGLYSSLPRTLAYSTDDWSGISEEEIGSSADLQRFLTSLSFCNEIIKVSPPSVRQLLLEFIHSGFLVPVIAPGLHQGASGIEEVIATTAYLNLFLGNITEPSLLRVFLRFILRVKVDEYSILDLLIQRITNPQPKLCIITLVLFKTLVELNCEDVMYHLVFKYLIPCTHVMVSQQRSIDSIDLYCKNAEKLMSLMPTCCYRGAQQNESCVNALTDSNVTSSQEDLLPPLERSRWWSSFRRTVKASPKNRYSVGDISPSLNVHSEDLYESSYTEYLRTARACLEQCRRACRHWLLAYDGRGTSRKNYDLAVSPEPQRKHVSSLEENQQPVESDVHNVPAVGREFSNPAVGGRWLVDSRVGRCQNSEGAIRVKNSNTESVDGTAVKPVVCASQHESGPTVPRSLLTSSADKPESSEVFNKVPLLPGLSAIVSNTSLSDDFDAFLNHLSRVPQPEQDLGSENVLEEMDSILESLENWRNTKVEVTYPTSNTMIGTSNPRLSEISSLRPTGTETASHREAVSSQAADEMEPAIYGAPAFLQKSILFDQSKIMPSPNQRTLERPNSLYLPIAETWNQNTLTPSPSALAKNFATSPTVGSPTVGPFLTTLLQRLESMKQNTFYVNLHLTSLIARLACYPQPLLTSILLSQTLVFQPSVKSLSQVLNSVKCRLEEYFVKVVEKDVMMAQALQYLCYRDGQLQSEPRLSLGDLRMSSTSDKSLQRKHHQLTLLGKQHGARYVPGSPSTGQLSTTRESPEFVEKKNAIYCALIMKEFLKELAAISQEQMMHQMSSSS